MKTHFEYGQCNEDSELFFIRQETILTRQEAEQTGLVFTQGRPRVIKGIGNIPNKLIEGSKHKCICGGDVSVKSDLLFCDKCGYGAGVSFSREELGIDPDAQQLASMYKVGEI